MTETVQQPTREQVLEQQAKDLALELYQANKTIAGQNQLVGSIAQALKVQPGEDGNVTLEAMQARISELLQIEDGSVKKR